ncbi:MAG: ATP-dependent DNA ligase [Acidimicrobiia bacterium]|nr:ATP-dependent DNA ligase [Acidimicrobiia bacterium]
MTRLQDLATTTDAVRRTSSRKAKTELLADLLRRLAPEEIEAAVGFLMAKPRQGAIGVGWATVAGLGEIGEAGLDDGSTGGESPYPPTVLGLDALLSEILATTGSGSVGARSELLTRFLAGCEDDEVEFVKRVLIGEARQGALAGVVTEAGAKAAGVKAAAMRRGAMLQGDLGEAIRVAIVDGADGLDAIDLEVQRPIQPMLASTAADVAEALDATGPEAAAVEWKFDGARIQVHVSRHGGGSNRDRSVSIYTRNLNRVTDRLGVVQAVVEQLACDSAVLDGEVLGFFGDDESPGRFQDTISVFATRGGDDSEGSGGGGGLQPYFFDLMYLDGESLIDRPLSERSAALRDLAEASGLSDVLIPQVFTSDPDAAQAHLDAALDAGHEGVMVKAADGLYEAGRRGKSWRKVKPVHTLDLVVLGAEWGHGRRRGRLSNLHLGARDGDTGDFVMVGKTFKGLTDELLAWQTEQFLARKLSESEQPGRHTVMIRPDMVVEIALDGAQRSTRYPGGVALRFARVKSYRSDKSADDADTIDTVRKLL